MLPVVVGVPARAVGLRGALPVLLLAACVNEGGLVPPEPTPEPAEAALSIAEVVTSNRDGLRDADGDSPDWIELRAGADGVDLGRWALSQDLDEQAWRLPEVTLGPGGRLVVFASGKDRREPELHADFRLAADGEPLFLLRDGAVIDPIDPVPPLEPDVAWGAAGLVLLDDDAPLRWRWPAADDDWAGVGYDDGAWEDGAGSVGTGGVDAGDHLADRLDRLQSWWTFDEAAAGEVPDLAGLHPGALEAGAPPPPGGGGRRGEGLSGEVGGWLAAGDPEGYDFAQDFTWSAWIRGTDGSGCLLSRNPAGTDWNQGSKALFVRSGTLQFDTGWVGNPDTGVPVTDGDWHHVAAAYAAAGDSFRLHVDGAVAWEGAFDNDAYPEDHVHNGGQAQTGLFVGEADFSGGLSDLGKYEGTIDEVAIWDVALDPDEVALLAAGTEPGPGHGVVDTPLPGGGRAQVRWTFEVAEPAELAALELQARYGDGLRVLLNGAVVALRNVEEGADVAASDRPDAQASTPEAIPLPPGALREGANVLAVEVLAAAGAEELLLDVRLLAEARSRDRLTAPTPGSANALARSGPVSIPVPSGVFGEVFEVEPEGPADAVVRYTTDGSEPGPDAAALEGPLVIERTTGLRARAWEPGRGPGPVASADWVRLGDAELERSWSLPVLLVSVFGEPGAAYRSGALFAWDDAAGPVDLAEPPDIHRLAIRKRGASSYGQAKAPYRIEVRDERGDDLDAGLLGLPADSDWALHAPWVDKSLMRNALAFELARAIGVEAPRTRYAHLLLDTGEGEVLDRGVYVLMETVKASPGRLDLELVAPDEPLGADPSGGWVVKFEGTVAEPPLVPGWETLEFWEPDPPTEAQSAAIEDHLEAFEAALFGPDDPLDGAAAWIDVASWVDVWVLSELFRDQDAYTRSFYLHRDAGGPLALGPLWDFNLVAGTGGYFDNTATAGWQWQHPYNVAEHGWFERLMQDPVFAEAARERWVELRAGLLSDAAMASRIDAHAELLAAAAPANFELWPNLGLDPVGAFVSPATDTWEEQVELLADWLAERSAWIDQELGP